MNKLICAFLLLIVAITGLAQQKMLTLEDAMLKARTTLAPENLKQLQFMYGTGDYVYLKKMGEPEVWMKGNFKQFDDQVLMTLDMLNEKLKPSGNGPLTTMPAIQFNQGPNWLMMVNGSRVALNPQTNGLTTIASKELLAKENMEAGSAGAIAYLDNHNLFVTSGGVATQVTQDGTDNIVYASSVHREEFGIEKGTFWSNDGQQLAFYRMDQSMVTGYPIVNWAKSPAVNENIKYPMAGGKSHHVTVGVYNVQTKNTVWLKTGEPAEQYLTNIAWSPDNKSIYIAVLNRQQNHVWLNQYDAANGSFIKTLFEETDDKYTEPLVPMQFLKTNPQQFIWQSNRDGWNHLYLYDVNGKLIKQLTRGNWEVLAVNGFDTKEETLFFTATAESAVTKNLYSLQLKTGKLSRVTTVSGVHNVQLSSDGKWLLDNYSSATNPRTIQVTDIKTGKSKTLLQAANPLSGYAAGALSIFTIPAKGGDSLYARLYKPVNFDAAKKHPVVVYWYGGPHAQMITNSWNGGPGDYWFQYLAQRGYVVFTIDTRGSDNRGRAFEQSMFRKLGDVQMEDLLTGVDYLKQQPFVDASRMGLFGWSFGGFLTTNFMLNHPGIFKAAVAGGPVMDWRLYEIMYTERYMDTPQENPDGYAATDLTKQVEKLKGKLLLIHGMQDPVVVQQHSVNFVKACVDKGVQVDYMIYPGHEHNVLGKDRVHLYQKVTDYLEQGLK
jgi:dipeptidyl-peptidase 4